MSYKYNLTKRDFTRRILNGKKDVLQAFLETRRPSKRQKDLADILRLVEKRKDLARFIPAALKSRLSL